MNATYSAAVTRRVPSSNGASSTSWRGDSLSYAKPSPAWPIDARPPSKATKRSAGAAVLRVCDRGPGVPEAFRERIFEAFFRLPGHAEREGGVGLGLSLVKQIAERHSGQVRCEARDGGGSCFVITLPA